MLRKATLLLVFFSLTILAGKVNGQLDLEKQARFLEMAVSNKKVPAMILLRELVSRDSTGTYRLADAAEALILSNASLSQSPSVDDIDLLQQVYNQAERYDPAGPGEWYLRKGMLILRYPNTFSGRQREIISKAVQANPFDCPLVLYERWLDAEIADYKNRLLLLDKLLLDWQTISQLLQSRVIRHADPTEPAGRVQLAMRLKLRGLVPDCKDMAVRHRTDPTSLSCTGLLVAYALQDCIASDRLWLDAFACAIEKDDAAWIYRLAAKEDLNHLDYIHAENSLASAIEREQDPALKANDYMNLADIYARTGEFSLARTAIENAIRTIPAWGQPYVRLAELYIEGIDACELSEFEEKAVYWLAIDLCKEAKYVDPSVTLEADRHIFRYGLNRPSYVDITNQGLSKGDTVQFPCWMNTSTKVRFQ
jgi:tetratricopeptide (TPR) repeat protein